MTAFQNCAPGFVPKKRSGVSTIGLGSGGGEPGGREPLPNDVAFAADIKPIIQTRCIQCHSTGKIAARLNYESSDSVAALGAVMLAAVDSGRMPPWGADNSGACGNFKFDPHMTSTERALFAKWLNTKVVGGTPVAGERGIAVTAPQLPALTPNGNDVVALKLAAPYTPRPAAGRVDDYRCFVLDPLGGADRYVTGYEVQPGNAFLVHHAILNVPTSAAEAARAVQLASGPERSYSCFGSTVVSAQNLVIWAPGTGTEYFPAGTGIYVPAGRELILQIHYNTSSTAPGASDQSQIILKTVAAGVTPARWAMYAGDQSGVLPANTATIARPGPAIPSGVFGNSARIYGFFPHMHTRGTQISIEKSSVTGDQCLVRVNRWDFNWQYNYFAETPVPLSSSDRIKVNCTYSTSGIMQNINFGEGTMDEMCYGFLYLTDDAPKITSVPEEP